FVGNNVVSPSSGLSIARDRVVWSTCETRRFLGVLKSGERGELQLELLGDAAAWLDDAPVGIPGDTARVVVSSTRSGASELWIVDLAGKSPPRKLASPGLTPVQPTVSADGQWVAFASEH